MYWKRVAQDRQTASCRTPSFHRPPTRVKRVWVFVWASGPTVCGLCVLRRAYAAAGGMFPVGGALAGCFHDSKPSQIRAR